MRFIVQALLALSLAVSALGYTRNDCVCGVANNDFSASRPQGPKYAWMVALATMEGEAFCGGALISDRHVISAGSCISFDPANRVFWKNIIGKVTAEQLKNGQAMNFRQIFLHPSFATKGSLQTDLAILEYREPIQKYFGPLNTYRPITSLPVCVPQIKQPNINKNAIVIGYGTSDDQVSRTFGQLRQNVVKIAPPQQCMLKNTRRIAVYNSLLCGVKQGPDQCPHDKGSPVFVVSAPNNFELIGITATADVCGGNYPRSYVDITNSLSWIWSILNGQAGGVCPRTLNVSNQIG